MSAAGEQLVFIRHATLVKGLVLRSHNLVISGQATGKLPIKILAPFLMHFFRIWVTAGQLEALSRYDTGLYLRAPEACGGDHDELTV